jgi:hypothetical protein
MFGRERSDSTMLSTQHCSTITIVEQASNVYFTCLCLNIQFYFTAMLQRQACIDRMIAVSISELRLRKLCP